MRLGRFIAVAVVALLAMAGTGTVVAAPLPANPPALLPARLHIPAIGVDAPVAPVGTVVAEAPFLGGQPVPTFGVPPDGSSVGWWSDGPLVGAPGMSILLGHTQVGGYAVFNRLGELGPGAEVSVTGQGGAVTFRVSHVVYGVPKNDPGALQRVLTENAASARLALITCGGEFDHANRASADNIVAFATLA